MSAWGKSWGKAWGKAWGFLTSPSVKEPSPNRSVLVRYITYSVLVQYDDPLVAIKRK